MSKKTKVILAAAAVGILLLLLGIFSVNRRLRRAESAFGTPAETLSAPQRLRILWEHADDAEELTRPAGTSGMRFVIEISESQSAQSTANAIAEGLALDSGLLLDYWMYSGADRALRPGRYVLTGAMTIPEITKAVTAAENALVIFSFLPGMRLEEVAELIDLNGFSFTGDEFLTAAQNYPAALHPAGETSLEGYLIPGSYEMSRAIPLDVFLTKFTELFTRKIKEPYEAGLNARGLTLHEGVILASMIAREAISAEEYPLIASVFYNRLNAGMKLESDPTAQYAIGRDAGSGSWWKTPLTGEDVSVYSEYNTYVVSGLPAGPICNPSPAVYNALINPAETDYFYFRARCDGSPYHNFAVTYEEHVNNACE